MDFFMFYLLTLFLKIYIYESSSNKSMVYFPPEIYRIIYGFDPTYKTVYKECIQEMKAKFNYNRCICLLNSIFYKNSFYHHDTRKYNSIPQFVRNHALRHKHVDFSIIMDYFRIMYHQITCCVYCRKTKGKLYVVNYRHVKN